MGYFFLYRMMHVQFTLWKWIPFSSLFLLLWCFSLFVGVYIWTENGGWNDVMFVTCTTFKGCWFGIECLHCCEAVGLTELSSPVMLLQCDRINLVIQFYPRLCFLVRAIYLGFSCCPVCLVAVRSHHQTHCNCLIDCQKLSHVHVFCTFLHALQILF